MKKEEKSIDLSFCPLPPFFSVKYPTPFCIEKRVLTSPASSAAPPPFSRRTHKQTGSLHKGTASGRVQRERRNETYPMSGGKFSAAKLLGKYGWNEGEGLGKDGQGNADYVRVQKKDGTYGIGADKSKFCEAERMVCDLSFFFCLTIARPHSLRSPHPQKHTNLLDDVFATIAKTKKDKKKQAKKDKKDKKEKKSKASSDEAEAEDSDAAKEAEESAAAVSVSVSEEQYSGFVVSRAKLVQGKLEDVARAAAAAGEKAAEDSDASSSDSDDSSASGRPGVFTGGIVNDADLFSACGGARFGKLGRTGNSQKKIARIRQLEEDAGSKLIAQSRARWSLQQRKSSRSPKRSPTTAPARSPGRRPTPAPAKPVKVAEEAPQKKEKRKLDSPSCPPAKRDKKEKKAKKEKKEKKEKKR